MSSLESLKTTGLKERAAGGTRPREAFDEKVGHQRLGAEVRSFYPPSPFSFSFSQRSWRERSRTSVAAEAEAARAKTEAIRQAQGTSQKRVRFLDQTEGATRQETNLLSFGPQITREMECLCSFSFLLVWPFPTRIHANSPFHKYNPSVSYLQLTVDAVVS